MMSCKVDNKGTVYIYDKYGNLVAYYMQNGFYWYDTSNTYIHL